MWGLNSLFTVSYDYIISPNRLKILIMVIAELAEHSPIIIQNSSNPSKGATFIMCGQLYHGHTYATALFSSPVVSALDSESNDPGSSPGWGKALCP